MRLVTRTDASLVGGLIASALILFHQPLRSVLDVASEVEQQYQLDFMPALIVLGAVFMYHIHEKRQHWLGTLARAQAEAEHYQLRTKELESLVLLSRGLSNALDTQGLRDAAMRDLPKLTGGCPYWILLKEPDAWESLVVDASMELESSREDIEEIAQFAVAATPAGSPPPPEGLMIGPTLCFPLAMGSTTIGVLGISTGSPGLEPTSRRALGVAASTIGVAVRNVHLLIETRELNINDSLTGCLVRKPGLAALENELRRARRFKQSFCILVIDIDHFKSINDRYGHLCGDQVLAQVGKHLRERLRATDHRCRYGGDEFIVGLPGTASAGAERVAEVLRTAIHMEPIEYEGQTVPVTVSIGIASIVPGELDLKAVINRADQALYRAKQLGRNCWHRASGLLPDGGFGASLEMETTVPPAGRLDGQLEFVTSQR